MHSIFSVWNRAILVEIYPIFAALGVGAFSASRLVEGPGKGTLQALAMVMLLSALGLSIVYFLQAFGAFPSDSISANQ